MLKEGCSRNQVCVQVLCTSMAEMGLKCLPSKHFWPAWSFLAHGTCVHIALRMTVALRLNSPVGAVQETQGNKAKTKENESTTEAKQRRTKEHKGKQRKTKEEQGKQRETKEHTAKTKENQRGTKGIRRKTKETKGIPRNSEGNG